MSLFLCEKAFYIVPELKLFELTTKAPKLDIFAIKDKQEDNILGEMRLCSMEKIVFLIVLHAVNIFKKNSL